MIVLVDAAIAGWTVPDSFDVFWLDYLASLTDLVLLIELGYLGKVVNFVTARILF